ncbi:MAG: hypothetical protein ACRDU0_18440 [Mycobacterium sp.]
MALTPFSIFRFVAEREAAAFSREHIAVAHGRSAQADYGWDRGYSTPPRATLARIAKPLGGAVADLCQPASRAP